MSITTPPINNDAGQTPPPQTPPPPPVDNLEDEFADVADDKPVGITRQGLKERVGRAKASERRQILAQLGNTPIEQVVTKLARLGELETATQAAADASKTNEERLTGQIQTLTQENQTIKAERDALIAEKRTGRAADAVIVEASAKTAITPRNVLAWAKEYRPDEWAKVLTETGEPDPTIVAKLVADCMAENRTWFKTQIPPGSPPIGTPQGPPPLNPDDLKKVEAEVRNQVKF